MLDPEEAARFHGHKGPFLAWGYRAARLAEKLLKPRGLKDLVCEARLPLRTPYTCILDGVQAGSRCTLGKCNLRAEEGDEVVLVFRSGGRAVEIRPALDLRALASEGDMEKAFYRVLSMPQDDLFKLIVREG